MKRIFKRIWNKFIINENGAVSIYLIIIALLLLLFNAVLIDYARIMIAERQTEEAAKTAIRSTMSSYNTSLQNKGLFGFEGDQGKAEAIFKEVFAKNLSTGEGDHFDFLNLKPVEGEISLDIHLERSLANEDILKYQILEEMKYKAPVEVGEALIKNFLSISEHIEEASNYAKLAKELNDDAEDREEKLDKVEELLNEAKGILDDMNGRIHNGSQSTYPDVNVLADILQHHVKYTDDLEDIREAEEASDSDDEDTEEIDVDELKERSSNFKQNSLKLLDDLINLTTIAVDRLQEAQELIEEAEEINGEMQDKIDNQENSSGDYDDAKDVSENLDGSSIEEDIGASLQDYVLDEEMFTNLKASVEEALRWLTRESSPMTDALLPKLLKDFRTAVNNDFDRNKNRIRNDINNSRDYHQKAKNKISEALDILEDGRKEWKDNKEAMEEKEENADESMDENKDQLDDIQSQIDAAAGALSDTELLKQLGIKANDYGDAIAANNQEFSMEDRDDTADEAMSFIDTLFKNLGDLLLNARDKVYINEYILMRFKSHDFGDGVSNKYAFENNQVEYIIYGLETHGANYFAALTEIFAVRFAINLAAGFMQPEARGFGPYIWAYALWFAFKETADDMNDITNGRTVQLFPGKSIVEMDYKDHLRLFLFAHSDGGKFSRLMAVLDKESGQDLREKSTYISAEATSTMQLWFLPQIIDILDSTNVINGRVEGNKFFIEKQVNFSY